MSTSLHQIFIHPPMAVARLGGSTIPLDAFQWVNSSDPYSEAETVIAPAWTLDEQPDGSVVPRMPNSLVFRDGPWIRPVAPFLELWGMVGARGSDPSRAAHHPTW